MSSATDKTVTVGPFDPNSINKQSDVIGPVTLTKAGVMTAEMLQQLNDAVAVGDVDLFVDPTNGSDSNPGTAAQPLKTLFYAASIMPAGKANRRIFLVGSTTAPLTNPDGSGVVNLQALDPAGPTGEPVTLIGDVSVAGPFTVTVSTNPYFDPAPNSRQLSTAPRSGPSVGAVVRVLDGPSAGECFLIANDDGTTLILNGRPGTSSTNTAINPGDTFQIETPSSVIDVQDESTFSGKWAFKNLKFLLNNTLDFGNGCYIEAMENVEVDGNGFNNFEIVDGAVVRNSSISGVCNAPDPFNSTLRFAAGLYVHDATFNVRGGSLGKGTTNAGLVLNNTFTQVYNGGSVQQNRIPLMTLNCGINVGEGLGSTGVGGELTNQARGSARGNFEGSLGGPAIVVDTRGTYVSQSCDINGSLGDGVFVGLGALAYIADMAGGAGPHANAGLGVDIKNGGFCAVDNDGGGGSAASVTGTGGDFQVGNLAVGTWAGIAGTTGSGETDGSGPTLNRLTILA